MQFSIFRLHFRSPLHVGGSGGGHEDVSSLVHSDTILGALYSLAVKSRPRFTRNLINGEVIISSAFPFFRNPEGITYFFPKPILPVENLFRTTEYPLIKRLKKLKQIPFEWFEKIMNGEAVEVSDKTLNEIEEKVKRVFKIQTLPKVTLDRITSSSSLYHYSLLEFNDGGLFFLAKFTSEAVKNEFTTLLELLGDEGLGGKRSAGYGFFEVETDTVELQIPEEAKSYSLLSLYWPPENERNSLSLKDSSYELIRRSGWFLLDDGRSYRWNPVWMFKEGSVINIDPTGGIADITPEAISDKRVYRFGFAFSLPIRVEVHADL